MFIVNAYGFIEQVPQSSGSNYDASARLRRRHPFSHPIQLTSLRGQCNTPGGDTIGSSLAFNN